jgi:hypothetical protein
MATQPSVGGQALPHPSVGGYDEEVFAKGATRRMASGALVRDLTVNATKLRFTLRWPALTATERGHVLAAYALLRDGTSRTFVAPSGTSYTVVLAENGDPRFGVVATKGGSALLYSGSLSLEEV